MASDKLKEYRDTARALAAEIEHALSAHVGPKAARTITRADARRALATLAAFNAKHARALRHKLTEHERKFAGIAREQASAIAADIARALARARAIADKHGVKLRLPETVRVRSMGDSYRYKLDTATGKAAYAPVKRKQRKAK